MLPAQDLSGLTFLDVGCGSGLSSLAARNLGASVHAFDFDPESVATAHALKQTYRGGDEDWKIEVGDILNRAYRAELGSFDVVYAWGVLHHTGSLRQAMAAVTEVVKPEGLLFIAIYNDQGWLSRYWSWVKKTYVSHPVLRPLLVACHAPYLIALRYLVRFVRRKGDLERGMSYWHDLKDWLGGYPFEVIRPEEVVDFYSRHGFALEKMRLVGRRHGCNEYVFELTS